MGMATTSDAAVLTRTAHAGGHVCRFSGHMRLAPSGGNRRAVSIIVAECTCGKLRAKYPEKLNYWDQRWIARLNRRVDRLPPSAPPPTLQPALL
jgi:hypothetical protein